MIKSTFNIIKLIKRTYQINLLNTFLHKIFATTSLNGSAIAIKFVIHSFNIEMKQFFAILLIFVPTILAHDYEHSTKRLKLAMFSQCELMKLYKEYQLTHNHYRHPNEHIGRMRIFRTEIRKILSFRSNIQIKWKAGINLMADMTEEEVQLMKGLHSNSSSSDTMYLNAGVPDTRQLLHMPAEFDEWRANKMIGPVRFQVKGSCWAHSAVVPMEAQIAQLTDRYRQLSVQELYDCVYPAGHDLSAGGRVSDAWQSVRERGRLGLDSEFPETLFKKRHPCNRYKGSTNGMEGFVVTKWYKVSTEHDLFEHLAAVSPITVSMDTKGCWLKLYRGGLFSADRCRTEPDHGMVVVGYTRDAIIVRNSWGTFWGDAGYVNWDRRGLKCCMLDNAFYPYVEREKKKTGRMME